MEVYVSPNFHHLMSLVQLTDEKLLGQQMNNCLPVNRPIETYYTILAWDKKPETSFISKAPVLEPNRSCGGRTISSSERLPM